MLKNKLLHSYMRSKRLKIYNRYIYTYMLTFTVLHCETNASSKKLLTLIKNSYTHGLSVITGTYMVHIHYKLYFWCLAEVHFHLIR